ncbi:MAG: hypothetical protein HY724_03335 [Candidatus Rokubacteria bacterium]|nr:hypothetical protein [Candidatus Rokubacteria bacterium]
MNSGLPELIRRARALSARRDRLVEAVAARWADALKGQVLSLDDLEELWAGLTEEAVRGLLKERRERWAPEAVRLQTAEVIARVRARVERALREEEDGSAAGA